MVSDGADGGQALADGEPDPGGQEGQAEEGGDQKAAGDVAGEFMAHLMVLGHHRPQVTSLIPLAEIAPAPTVLVPGLREACFLGQGLPRGMAGTQQQVVLLIPKLEENLFLILVEISRQVGDVVIVVVLVGQGQQKLRHLNQVGVEDLVDLVMGVLIGER